MSTQATNTGSRNLWLLAGGSTAIILGLVFLTENITNSDLDDLWGLAFFPLALALVAHARTIYSRAGTITGAVIGWATVSLSTAAVGLALALGLDAGELWPVFFIIIGAGAVLAAWR